MEDITLNLPQLKTVKKTTYNAITNQAHLSINRDSSPLYRGTRSLSFKTIANFVPKLKPLKSTFIPAPLRLNEKEKNFSNKGKEEEDINKLMSGDENDLNDDSSSSISSSDIDSSEEDSLEIKIKEKEDEIVYNSNSNSIKKKIEVNLSEKVDDEYDEENYDDLYISKHKYSNESWYKNSYDINKNIKSLRKKMSKIRVKVGISKLKETEEVIRDSFKNNFGIGLKKYEKNDGLSLYSSVNILENKENIKPKIRTIFEVISFSKDTIKK